MVGQNMLMPGQCPGLPGYNYATERRACTKLVWVFDVRDKRWIGLISKCTIGGYKVGLVSRDGYLDSREKWHIELISKCTVGG